MLSNKSFYRLPETYYQDGLSVGLNFRKVLLKNFFVKLYRIHILVLAFLEITPIQSTYILLEN